VIIALGEGVVGTIASLSALVGPEGPGWSLDAALVVLAGTALTFGMWWIYFVVPSGPVLDAHRRRSFGWALVHIPVIGAVVATGGGLHVAAYLLEEQSELDAYATVLCVVVPVAVYALGIFAFYAFLTRTFDPFHLWLIAATVALPRRAAAARGRRRLDAVVPRGAQPRAVGHRRRLRAPRARAQRGGDRGAAAA
jgi:low temperature requirement protein LtrA